MLLRIAIPILILAIGFFVARELAEPVPAPKPEDEARQLLETEVNELRRANYTVLLESQGLVRAQHRSTLTSSVAGTVVRVHPAFEDGAFFREGEVLLELDPADFRAALAAAESQLARAEATLAQEEARARQARLNWQDLGYDEEPSDLVLRVPQLKEARANVDSAQAELDQAARNLERTKVRAPFNGRVAERMVGLGQAVGASTALGEVFSTDTAEVRLPLTARQLEFIDLPVHENECVPVTLTDALGRDRDEPVTRRARLVRAEGSLDSTSRELFVIARIDDPFGLESDKPALRLGQPVRASIEGSILENVFVLPRQALRGVNTIYLVTRDEPAIERTKIDPVWSTADVIVVRDGLESGQWLATTRLPYAPNGAPVAVVEPATAVSVEPDHPGS